MRAILCASCLALTMAGQQKPADVYSFAIAKYIAGDTDAAFDALAKVPHVDIQKELEAAVTAIRRMGGGPAARRRLEAVAMLHTEYALSGGLDPKEVPFQIDMAHLAMTVDRWTVIGLVPDSTSEDLQRAREFLPRWSVLAVSTLLTYGVDTNATTVVEEALKLFPNDPKLLYWRGLVLEFQAVWVGPPSRTESRAAVPAMRSTDGAGYDMVTNMRVWAPVEDAYRRALALDRDNFEAHLHLGYASHSLRNYGPAKSEYELARDRSTDPFVVYVADLLLARLKEDQNDLAGGVPDYEHAIAKIPGAQSAYVGLGMLEARRGNAQRARDLTMRLAAIPEKQRARDPWWAFHTTRIPADDLEWLRKAVRK